MSVLLYYIRSRDKQLLEDCLANTNENVVRNTVQQLPTPYVMPFLDDLINKFQAKPSRGMKDGFLLSKIKAVSRIQGGLRYQLTPMRACIVSIGADLPPNEAHCFVLRKPKTKARSIITIVCELASLSQPKELVWEWGMLVLKASDPTTMCLSLLCRPAARAVDQDDGPGARLVPHDNPQHQRLAGVSVPTPGLPPVGFPVFAGS